MNDPQDKPEAASPDEPVPSNANYPPDRAGENGPSRRNKALDFCIGFFGYLGASIALAMAVGFTLPNSPAVGITLLAVLLTVGMAAAFYAYHKQRPYVAMGVLGVIVVPLLAWGTCAMVFMG